MKTISLCMIVKNESHVIERCLNSVKPLIDYVLIVDTGSTDNTIDVIKKWLIDNELPGEVIVEPWVNFCHNRSFALLELSKKEFIDYALMIDADEVLIYEESFNPTDFKSKMSVDVYDITTSMGGMSYVRPQLTSNKKEFKYQGVVHEFLTGDVQSRKNAIGFHNKPIQDSNRNRSGNKFEGDAKLLEKAIEETDDAWFKSRYNFYLAQTFRDLQRREESLKKYLERSQMGFWNEEVFVSYYNAATLMRELNYPEKDIIHTYFKGHESCPSRVECLHGLINYCRLNGLNQIGYIFGKQAILINKPRTALFSEEWMYDYGVLDEFSILAYYSANYKESEDTCQKLLDGNKFPKHYTDRILSNRQFATNMLS
jgi:glycosyltransferase involved in cell wall biosynthesis